MKNRDMMPGFALGLSNHSSMRNPSSMFHNSQVFELSSIKKQEIPSHSSRDHNFILPISINCKFCGQKEQPNHRLIKVCKCTTKCWAHEDCINSRQSKESTCKLCHHEFILNYDKESEASEMEESSILQSLEEQTDRNNQASTPQMSSLIESSGEARMRKVIKAATLKPYCRICKSGADNLSNKLIYPCQCHTVNPKKSWAHRNCIFDDIIQKQSDICPMCKAQFAFACETEKSWICKDSELCGEFTAQLFGIALLFVFCIGVIVFLTSTPGIDLDEGESVWRWILVALLVILLILSVLLLGFLIYLKTTEEKVKSIYVLCQRQEIAKMTSTSHNLFIHYLEKLKKSHLIPEAPPPAIKAIRQKKPKMPAEVIEDRKSIDFQDHMEEPEISRLIINTDTNGENFDSKALKEHSDFKESSIIHISFISSEDIKEEEMKEHSSFKSAEFN
ncbi:unnamed protein product [Blepharisma stoltei]|uniref:RING-CH-type domain-containing protein n=1 Tax=Blepharisma stoltei TaxID=1481888 RepID=A0AAU9IBU4_9CILI|nr:unnamed protein product [Blepharisma stoltei]